MASSAEKRPPPPRIRDMLMLLASEELTPGDLFGLRPEVLERMGRRAASLIDKGRIRAGEARLVELSAAETRSPSFPLLLGISRARRGAHDEALEVFDEAVRRARGVIGSKLEAVARLARAESLLALGRSALALDDLTEVAMTGPHREAARARARMTQINERSREGALLFQRSRARVISRTTG